jgi:uncharacterized integral membrane protein
MSRLRRGYASPVSCPPPSCVVFYHILRLLSFFFLWYIIAFIAELLPGPPGETGEKGMQGYLVLALIFAIIVALFAVQNTTVVVIKFLVWEANISLVLVILGAAAAGAIMLFFIDFLKQISVNRERKELLRQNAALMEEKEKWKKMMTDKDELLEEKDRLIMEKDNASQEKDRLPAEDVNDPV